MYFMRKAAACVAVVFLVSSFQQAEAGKSWKFNVLNKSRTPAVEFRTKEDGSWSKNWIEDRIQPGDEFEMDFGTDEGNCTVRTQITFTDGSFFDADVDYCKVSNLYIYENRLTWD